MRFNGEGACVLKKDRCFELIFIAKQSVVLVIKILPFL